MHEDHSKMDKNGFYLGTSSDSNVPICNMRQVRIRGANLSNLSRLPSYLHERLCKFLLFFDPLRSELHRKCGKAGEKVGILLLTFLCGGLDVGG